MKYKIISYTVQLRHESEISPGCTIGHDPEVIAEFGTVEEGKAMIRKLKSSVEAVEGGYKVQEYFLYEEHLDGDLSSMDSSDMEGYC